MIDPNEIRAYHWVADDSMPRHIIKAHPDTIEVMAFQSRKPSDGPIEISYEIVP